MTTTALHPARPSLRPSPHERAILAAIIAEQATIDDLLRCPKWTVDDVSLTMRRHHMVATEDGRIVRKRTIDDLLFMAAHSFSPHVKAKAKQAADQFTKLREAIDAERERHRADADLAQQRQAVEHWITWLTDALTDARAEKRRLRPPARKVGAARGT